MHKSCLDNHCAESKSLGSITKALKPLICAKVDVVALGCTHFPFLREEIEEILGPKVIVLDSNAAVARQVNRILTNNKQLDIRHQTIGVGYQFYTSGDPKNFKIQIENLTGLKINTAHKVDKKSCK